MPAADMERSATINTAAYLGAGLAGACLLAGGSGAVPPQSSAYLPIPLAIAVCEQQQWAMAAAAAIGCLVPFLGCLVAAAAGCMAPAHT